MNGSPVMPSPRRKLIVVSEHDFVHGIGSLTRILSVVEHFRDVYQIDQVEWLNLFPWNLRATQSTRARQKEIREGVLKPIMIPYPRLGILDSVMRRIVAAFMTVFLFVRYGRGTECAFWIEMTSSAWFVLPFALLFRVPMVVDVHGTVDEIVQFSPTNMKTARWYGRAVAMEALLVGRAAGLVTVSKAMQDFYRQRFGRIPPHVEVVPACHSRSGERWSRETRSEVRRQLDLKGKFVMVYAGGASQWQCIDEMLLLFDSIQKHPRFLRLRPYLFLIIWDERFNLSARLLQLGLSGDNMRCVTVPQRHVGRLLQGADVGLVLRRNLTTNTVSSPTKIAEYLHAGLPVITTPYVGDAVEILGKSRVGYFVELDGSTDFHALGVWCASIKRQRTAVAAKCIATAYEHFGPKQLNRLNGLADIVCGMSTTKLAAER